MVDVICANRFEFSAFTPLMENGGNGEHRPWVYDAPGSTNYTDAYRTCVGPFELI